MKPEFEKIAEVPQRSFSAKKVIRDSRPFLHQAWHYHPEIEVCFTEKSNGKRFVGNNISNYSEGDLVLFGSNLPHGFTTPNHCEQYVIQLNTDFLGTDFFHKPELNSILAMLNRAKRGLEFSGRTRQRAHRKIRSLLNTEGLPKLLLLLDVLHLLASSKEVKAICTEEYAKDYDASQFNRIKKVYDHIILNYQHEIRVLEIAQTINLTESAFYKFIKKHTKKTFTEIVNEFRINHATKLLISSEMTIAEICYDSGFNNLSYFNRKFKTIIGQTPRAYRANYAGG